MSSLGAADLFVVWNLKSTILMRNILLIDKPSGITSFDVIRRLRKSQLARGSRKMGHAGTLDPLATGLLIIGLDKATKQLADFMNLPKEYEVLIEFGKVSTTYDADGEISAKAEKGVLAEPPEKRFQDLLKKFIGKIQQMPPVFSAKRIKGERAYDLARKGEKVELALREVTIYSIEILGWNWPLVRLRIKCGKGTYIRSLAHDLGQELKCGAYVKELRRTAIGDFRVENAVKI